MLVSGPVAVDPTIEETGSQACTLAAEAPTTSYCASSTLQVGYDGTHQEHHGLLKFNLSELPAGAQVFYAKLGLYVQSHSTSSSKAVGVYRVTKPWTTSATWETYDGTHAWTSKGGDYANPANNSDASVNPSVGSATGWSYWYPTRMVQEWADTANAPENSETKEHEGYANEGLIVKDQTDSQTSNLLTLASPNATSDKPYLEVQYEPRGFGSSTAYTQLSTPLTDKLTMSVNPASGNLMLQSQDLHTNGTNGLGYSITTTFNNLNPEVMDDGRWQDSNRSDVEELADGSVLFYDPSGAFYTFRKNADGTYVTPPGLKATFCTSGHAPCGTLPEGTGSRLVYNQSQSHIDYNASGEVIDTEDRYKNKLTASYKEGVDAISSWTDTQGRKFENAVLTSSRSFYTEIKDVSGSRNIKYGYEGEGTGAQLTSYTDANSKTTKYQYEHYDLTRITTPKGNVVKLAYDEQHRVTEIVRTTDNEHTKGPTTTFTYYAVGSAPAPCTSKQQGTVVKDPDWTAAKAHETLYCANVLDEVEQTVDANKNATTATYNPFGSQASSTSAAPGSGESGSTINHVYGEAGQNLMCSVQGASGPESKCPATPNKSALVTTYGYVDKANPYSSTETADPQGNEEYACYNKGEPKESKGPACPTAETGAPAGSLQNINDQLSSEKELKFGHNGNGTINSSTDADKHMTEYLYDEHGNLKEIKPPVPLVAMTIKIDADSRPEVITDGAGHKETITYDKLDRVTKIEYAGTGAARTVKFEYDADGNIIKREDSTETVKYTVDALNRLTKEELSNGVTHSYEYDPASNMKSFTDGSGTTSYKYNGLNELESMTEPEGAGTDTFNYDNDQHLTKITYPSKVTEHYKLESATGRPETITPEGTTGTTVPTLSYTYKTAVGENDTSLVQSLSESAINTTGYTYDALNRLIKTVTSGTSNPSFYKFKLDGAGNRTEQKVNLSKAEEAGSEATYYGYNAADELECRQTVVLPCSKSSSTELSGYEYDKAGDETAITPKSDTSGTTFAYNAASELSTLTPSGESAYSLTYGGTGQDDLRTRGASDEVGNSLLGVTHENNNGSVSAFERTPNGLLIDIRGPSGNYNPLYDAQGDVIGLVSSSGKVERTFRYGPYGENIKSEGTQTVPYPFGYKGGYRMPGGNSGKGNVANNVVHFGERYYDPTVGRWTQQDQENHVGDPTQADRFGFAANDPVNQSDPTGKSIYGCSSSSCASPQPPEGGNGEYQVGGCIIGAGFGAAFSLAVPGLNMDPAVGAIGGCFAGAFLGELFE